jgi:aminopeptidase N
VLLVFVKECSFLSASLDMLQTTHPVEVKLEKASQMNDVFDFISYGKGTSVLRMIEAFLGEEPFRQGF